MDEPSSPAGPYVVDREKTAPFLIRAFVKVNGFHRPQQFEDGPLPVADEQQLFTWKDATLTEVLTTLRNIAPLTPEYRHPLARYSFRAIFADPTARGRFSFKDLGTVYSRDILGEPGTLDSTAPRLLKDSDGERTADGVEPQPQAESGAGGGGSVERERRAEVRTLDELRFVPGDYMSVSVILPKNATVVPGELSIKGSAGSGIPPPSNGWKGANAVGLGSGRDQLMSFMISSGQPHGLCDASVLLSIERLVDFRELRRIFIENLLCAQEGLDTHHWNHLLKPCCELRHVQIIAQTSATFLRSLSLDDGTFLPKLESVDIAGGKISVTDFKGLLGWAQRRKALGAPLQILRLRSCELWDTPASMCQAMQEEVVKFTYPDGSVYKDIVDGMRDT